MKTVGQLKLDLFRDISPASPDDSRDLYGAIEQGVEEMLSYVKPRDLAKRIIVENALYDQVNRYTAPDDLDTNKILQWYRLKDNREAGNFFYQMNQVNNRDFDMFGKYGNAGLFTIEYQSGKKFIKVSDDNNGFGGYTLHTMNSLTDGGNWLTFGNVTNLAFDNLTFVSGSGSLRFDINNSSNTGGVEVYLDEDIDIHEFLNVGKVFTWLNLPNLNQIQTITLDLMSSLTDYYSITVNSPHDTDTFQLDQNMLGFALDRETMNTIGTPNPRGINHIRFTFVTNGTLNMNSVRLDNIVARKGVVYGIQYLSNMIFKDATSGLMRSRPLLDSDVLILEYDTYQMLRGYCSSILAQELVSNNGDLDRIEKGKDKAIAIYKMKHKEEYIDETQVLRRFGVPYGRAGWNDGDGGFIHYHHDIVNIPYPPNPDDHP